jgi:hypothetical protein
MRTNLITLLMALSSSLSTYAGNPHQHSHETQLHLNHGKKWQTDQSLREGMEQIRKLIITNQPKLKTTSADQTLFADVAGEIEKQVQAIFKSCKLPPEADAQLHILIVQIIEGAKKMREAVESEDQRTGVIEVTEALVKYGQYFDHRGWEKLGKFPN